MKKIMTITVYATTDYEIFKKLDNNREPKSVKKIMKSIEKVGYIPSPLLCNEKMQVIDGQNRLEALKQLQLPVYYYVVEGIGIDEARQMNLNRQNWKPMDYIKSYAKEGNVSYKRLIEIMDLANFIGIAEAYGVCKRVIINTGMAQSKVGNGQLTISLEEFDRSKKAVKWLKQFETQIKDMKGNRRLIVTALAWCYGVDGLDRKRLTMIIKERYPLIRPALDIDILLSDISDLYNKGLDKGKRLYFDTLWKMEK